MKTDKKQFKQMVTGYSPMRISFLGGGTDFPEWFKKNNGGVIGATINKFSIVTLKNIPEIFGEISKFSSSKYELKPDATKFNNKVSREILTFSDLTKNISVNVETDIPSGTGLGSSSAFCCALTAAIAEFKSNEWDESIVAKQSTYFERKLLGESGGYQDQILSSHGSGIIEFKKRSDYSWSPINTRQLEFIQPFCLLLFTGKRRSAHELERQKINTIDKNIEVYRNLYRIFQSGKSMFTRPIIDISEFGELLTAHWREKNKISTNLDRELFDFIFSKFNKQIIGAKLLGAGNGGFLLLLVDPENQMNVKKELSDFYFEEFKFINHGVKTKVIL